MPTTKPSLIDRLKKWPASKRKIRGWRACRLADMRRSHFGMRDRIDALASTSRMVRSLRALKASCSTTACATSRPPAKLRSATHWTLKPAGFDANYSTPRRITDVPWSCLFQAALDPADASANRTIDSHIKSLRRKPTGTGADTSKIESVYGSGCPIEFGFAGHGHGHGCLFVCVCVCGCGQVVRQRCVVLLQPILVKFYEATSAI